MLLADCIRIKKKKFGKKHSIKIAKVLEETNFKIFLNSNFGKCLQISQKFLKYKENNRTIFLVFLA